MKSCYTDFIVLLVLVLGFSLASVAGNEKDPRLARSASPTIGGTIQPTIPLSVNATVLYVDSLNGLNDTTSLKARGYKPYYRGTGPQGSTATWYQGVPTVFPAYNGDSAGYVAANFNVVTGTNNIDSWLVFPRLNLQAGDTLKFFERSPLSSPYPDSIRVMHSAVGDSIPEAASWVELGRFKTTTNGTWGRRLFAVPTSGATARFAIRYAVVNGGPGGANSNYIGIDMITVERTAGPPVVNRALLLPTPGVNTNYVQIPFQASMVGFGNNITIEAWVKLGGSTTPNTVLNKGAGSFDYQLGINSSTTGNPFFRAGGTVIAASTMVIPTGVWLHLAVTYDGTTIKFYRDGVLGFSQATVLTFGSSTNEMRIGRGNNDPGTGNIEEVRLWSVARTQGQIDSTKCLKYPGQFLSTAGLKALWHFDSTYVDSVSNYNGTPLGNVGFEIATLPCGPVGVAENHPDIPDDYQLAQNYPNPFNPTTTIQFGLPVAANVTVKIYNVLGQEVTTLVDGLRNAGTFQAIWDGRNTAGTPVASGMYFYSLVARSADNASTFTNIKKMLFLK